MVSKSVFFSLSLLFLVLFYFFGFSSFFLVFPFFFRRLFISSTRTCITIAQFLLRSWHQSHLTNALTEIIKKISWKIIRKPTKKESESQFIEQFWAIWQSVLESQQRLKKPRIFLCWKNIKHFISLSSNKYLSFILIVFQVNLNYLSVLFQGHIFFLFVLYIALNVYIFALEFVV